MRPFLMAVVIAANPFAAGAFSAQNGLGVKPAGEAVFAVSWRGRSGASDFWCAAGDYVIGALGLPGGTRIYRYDPPVRRAGADVRFGLDPARAERTGLLRLQGGRGLTAAYARQFCDRDRR